MKVEIKVFLKQKMKKITIFSIVPDLNKELEATRMLQVAVLNYVFNDNISYNKFYEEGNPFNVIIVEGMFEKELSNPIL